MRVLGVDFGLRHIGLALSDEGATLASPLRAIAVASVREAPGVVAAAAREAEAGAIVVGAPFDLEEDFLDEKSGERLEGRRVRRFAQALRRATGLPVHVVDESLSSREAAAHAASAGRDAATRARSGRAAGKDAQHAAAAAVILQRWLDERHARTARHGSHGRGERP